MATYVIGDIHGNARALGEVVEQITAESGTGDTVVFVGDYIDRGPRLKRMY
jgi:serine/threonine protein phosphatase 1